ncbi:aminoglycoside phosphotransferase [Microbulbifer agarilyticus]|uniref:Aminoglycoside phosphotransferase n=1 Tax=Microbulbifer agarilyticus TaxID=260552 RepID=A0A1Q2M3E3_9GAMM|nr:phosphotransferase [Microbulbifer agarilyticus]AQQ67221.1 aminoglycoside phosphotransferase [Microbulbifer agarilyticus]
MDQVALCDYLIDKGLLHSQDATFTALSGGVSCEILLVDDGQARFVVKRALDKLKVKDDWFADIKRNITEQEYLRYVGAFLPESVPAILYSDAEKYFFCMEMIEGGLENWKSRLLLGEYDRQYARLAGSYLGSIHKQSLGDSLAQAKFDTLKDFTELRLEPYLLKTGSRHPGLNTHFVSEADRIASTATCLIHGDYSPKNLMVGNGKLVILDCEVAWYGDPVFDVAFLLNHFLLKALHKPKNAAQILGLGEKVWEAYLAASGEVVDDGFESRLCHLLPMLMLARVDGKSPVEYLNACQQQTVRNFAYAVIPDGPTTLSQLLYQWTELLAAE